MTPSLFEGLSGDAWVTFLMLAIAVTASGGGLALVMLLRLRHSGQHSGTNDIAVPLQQKMDRIVSLTDGLSALNSEVQAEFELQRAATEKAKQEAEHAEAIAALNETQRAAAAAMVKSQLDASLATNGKSDRKFQVWLSIGSFFAGILVAIVVPLIFVALGIGA